MPSKSYHYFHILLPTHSSYKFCIVVELKDVIRSSNTSHPHHPRSSIMCMFTLPLVPFTRAVTRPSGISIFSSTPTLISVTGFLTLIISHFSLIFLSIHRNVSLNCTFMYFSLFFLNLLIHYILLFFSY